MTILPPISLDTDWICAYFEVEPVLFEFANDQQVDSLAEWSFAKNRVDNWAAWLKRSFQLEATDYCVNYFLYLDSAPAGTRIYLNGQQVATYTPPGLDDPPYELDITLNVALGANEIAFRVDWNAAGQFAGVRLQPVPCE